MKNKNDFGWLPPYMEFNHTASIDFDLASHQRNARGLIVIGLLLYHLAWRPPSCRTEYPSGLESEAAWFTESHGIQSACRDFHEFPKRTANDFRGSFSVNLHLALLVGGPE
jgi:hypothetical protein